MTTICKALTLAFAGATTLLPFSQTQAQRTLEGDTRLACEAILCLASGNQPGECSPSLQRYFSIRHKKFSDTLKARNGFLNLCPVSQQTPQMSSLINSLTQGAGRCDANSLNAVLRQSSGGESEQVTIGNQMPGYCAVYFQHEYTNFKSLDAAPKYVGIPQRGGHWVEAAEYTDATSRYVEKIRAEDLAREQMQNSGG